MENRQYFIIKVPNENVIHSLNVCIGFNSTQMYNNNNDKLFVKCTKNLVAAECDKGVKLNKIFPPGLTTEYTYEEIKVILQGEEWQTSEL